MKPTVICGPSGVGIKSLVKRLQLKLSDTFAVAISHTTREPRKTETNGIDYYFIDKKQFEIDIADNKFIEYVLYDNEYFGTSIKAINDINNKNLICILEIDVFGAEKLQKNGKIECNYLYITTSNGLITLKKRLIKKNTQSNQKIQSRLQTAQKELDFLQNNPNFFDCVIYNDKDIDETFYQLIEQLNTCYPNLKKKILHLENENKENEKKQHNEHTSTSYSMDLENVQKINSVSKRQSIDLFADFASNANELFITRELLCKKVLNSDISPFKDNENIISIIVEYADISPQNRKKQWKAHEFGMILDKLSLVEHRWTIGNNINSYPSMNINTIGDIYFAYHEFVMTGVIFYLCGTVQCPIFAKKYYGAQIENMEKDWDKCWDVYFYMKCDSDLRGSVQFSRQWTNMLIFGIDSDAVRQAAENGIWKLNTKQSQNFLIKASAPSSICEDEQMVDDD